MSCFHTEFIYKSVTFESFVMMINKSTLDVSHMNLERRLHIHLGAACSLFRSFVAQLKLLSSSFLTFVNGQIMCFLILSFVRHLICKHSVYAGFQLNHSKTHTRTHIYAQFQNLIKLAVALIYDIYICQMDLIAHSINFN